MRAPEPEPFVRLDSLDPVRDGRSLRFGGFRGCVEAYRNRDVVPALNEVEAAVGRGLHAAGFLAYEAGAALDPDFACRSGRPGLPLLWFALFERRAERRESNLYPPVGRNGAGFELGPLRSSVEEPAFRAAVRRIREHIAAGDTYQVNHTFRLRGTFRGSERALYRRLCLAQRSAFCAYLRLPRFSILSASPELFFRWTGSELELRPMKGTAARGRWTGEDDSLAAALAASEKERAENLMIVDLARNDAGRVAEPGSVRVEELFRVERYPTVHQLTSTVRARTVPAADLEGVLRALFPSGSVTGAPKLRTSEIIAALEDSPRGVYTGAIGFVSPGEAVFSVAIRTLLLDRETGDVELGIGAGITWDSDPAAEYRESLAKAAFVGSPTATGADPGAGRAGVRPGRPPAPDFALLASLRFERGEGYLLLNEQLERLAGSARTLGFPFDADTVRARLLGFAGGLEPGAHKVRAVLRRDGRLEIESEPIRSATAPVRLGLAADPVDSRDPLLYHKTTRREGYRTRRASRPDCEDVLLRNERGELTEATRANVLLRLEREWVTPPVDAGLLPGVFRAHLLPSGALRERRVTPEDLERAEEVVLINAVRRWRPATLVRASAVGGAPSRQWG